MRGTATRKITCNFLKVVADFQKAEICPSSQAAFDGFPALHPLAEEIEKGKFQRTICAEAAVADAQALADGLYAGIVGFQPFQVILPRGGGINEKLPARFHVLEHDGFVEREVQLGGVEEMKKHDFVAARGEGGEVFFQRANGAEQVGNQHQQGAFFYGLDDALERRGEIGGGAGGGLFELEHQMAQMSRAMARGKISADLLVKGKQAHGVALKVKEIREGGGERVGVLRFRVTERAVLHGAALVHDELASQVGFVLEFLDEIAVAAGVEAPVKIAWIVAG